MLIVVGQGIGFPHDHYDGDDDGSDDKDDDNGDGLTASTVCNAEQCTELWRGGIVSFLICSRCLFNLRWDGSRLFPVYTVVQTGPFWSLSVAKSTTRSGIQDHVIYPTLLLYR